jgi:small subunit ribosomal protein S6
VSRLVRSYELIFIVHPEVDDAGLAAVIETVKELVERGGGRVGRIDRWGLRRLAYPINKLWEGQYVLMYLEMDPQQVAELERSFALAEQILRHLVVRLEEGMVGAGEAAGAEGDAQAVEEAEGEAETETEVEAAVEDEAVEPSESAAE